MPKREDEFWANEREGLRYCLKHKRYYRADIGCQLCAYEKLERGGEKEDIPRLQKCPECGKKSLFWNRDIELYECLNLKCKKTFAEGELGSANFGALSKEAERESSQSVSTSEKNFGRVVRLWANRLVSIGQFSFRIIRRTIRAFWRKRRTLRAFWRMLPKIVVLVAVLATTAIVISTVCQFVTGNLQLSSVVIFSVVGLGILVWCLKSLSRYRLSFTRFFIVLLISGLFIIVSSAYLDIRSPMDIRDHIMGALTTEKGEFRSTVDLIVQRAELKIVDIAGTVQETVSDKVEEIASTNHVHVRGGILVGADGHYITLENNSAAIDLSWAALKSFLLKDKTDSMRYSLASFVCADFAEMLHNNAEVAGIRAAYVAVQLGPCSYYTLGGGHALNAFQTTDRGLVYIDCTGSNQGVNADKVVEVKEGREYIPESIFPEPGWSAMWGNMGVVEEIEVIQW